MFLNQKQAFSLIEQYGEPLYVYHEETLRNRCREVSSLLAGYRHEVLYSAKANSNPELLSIVHQEGLHVDAMSPGELFLERKAGIPVSEIFYVCNNISKEEMSLVYQQGVLLSVDSLSQLAQFGSLFPGGRIAIRLNPELGAGHHEKVITGGKKTKFGIQFDLIPEAKRLLEQYDLRLVGVNQHIGSLFMQEDPYVDGVRNLLDIVLDHFPGLDFIDFGGGFGVPYHEGEARLDFPSLDRKLSAVIGEFLERYDNKEVRLHSEPGRYIVAECGILLSRVNAVKENHGTVYVGTDIGQNVLVRPSLYDAYHEVRVIKKGKESGEQGIYTIVGNICESGDILAKKRLLPAIEEGDLIAVMNAGAYGYSMASNYTCRLRPAEVLLAMDGSVRLIRRRDTMEDLYHNL